MLGKKYSTQIKLKSEYDFHPTKYLIDYLDKTFRKIANDLETSKPNIKKIWWYILWQKKKLK